MSEAPKITGPESLVPGTFYHNSSLRGIVYVATAKYWQNPATGEREPQPGTESMHVLNGDLPGAIVAAPGDEDQRGETVNNLAFWEQFHPAPGLDAWDIAIEGIRNAAGQLRVVERETKEKPIAAAVDTAIGTLQRVEQTIRQIGHTNYAESRPMEIRAKDRTIGLYVEFINMAFEEIGRLAKRAIGVANRYPSATFAHEECCNIAERAARLTHLSPAHPEGWNE